MKTGLIPLQDLSLCNRKEGLISSVVNCCSVCVSIFQLQIKLIH